MIQSFKDKEAEHLFERAGSRKLPPDIQRTALRKLWMIDAAQDIHDLKAPPSNHLEKLKGSRLDQYSIRINDQWRICFRWHNGNAYEVEIIDYH
jgi:proteic killer suppression protein